MAKIRPSTEEERRRIAEHLRERYQWLNSFTDDELREISMCKVEEGDPQEDELYFDLSHPEKGSFKGHPGRLVPEGSCYVARSQVDERLWNKLTSFFESRGLRR